jgi:hypothetical protein
VIRLFWLVFWGGLSALVVTAGLKAMARKRAALSAVPTQVDDAAVRSIIDTGALGAEPDEPLDLGEIDDEEERFWSEAWEEPEEL